MNLIVNGEEQRFDRPLTVAELLETLDIRAPRVAVMVNEAIIKRDKRPEHRLAEGDRVEIIHMVGGG